MKPTFPSNLKAPRKQTPAAQAPRTAPGRDALRNAWSSASAAAAERGAAYLAHRVPPTLDRSEPRARG
jgi:hypothetical protein